MAERTMTRRDFLRAAGTGVTGATLLGAPAALSGCGGSGSGMNAIVVILDSLRRDHVGAHGNEWMTTPTLDALAKESLRFNRPYPDAMPTIPARRAIHTGMRTLPFQEWEPNEWGSRNYGWSSIPERQATLAEILKGTGYATALVTDTYHQFEMNFGRGFDAYHRIRGQEDDRYKDPSIVSEQEMRRKYLVSRDAEKARQYLANVQGRKTEEDWFAPRVFLGGMELLKQASRRQPFFVVVDCYDPHEPWDPPQQYVDLYDAGYYEGKDPLYPKYGKSDYLSDQQILRMRALYSAEVTMTDRWLGNFLQMADDLGVMDNTLLVVISDHGHALGEHGYTGKPSFALWPELTDIVFMIRHPEGKGAGEQSNFYASTHDVAPTVLGSLGIKPPSPMDGQNLSVLLEGEDPQPRNHFTSAYRDYVWARDERRVMFARHDGSERRLYDAQNDPHQQKELSEDEPEVAERMFEDYILRDSGKALTTG